MHLSFPNAVNRYLAVLSVGAAALLFPSGSNGQGLANVSIDQGQTDLSNGLTRMEVSDGDTSVATIGGLECRRNLSPSDDTYMYFAVDDALGFAGSKPYVWIYFHYFDVGTGTLRIQYDATTNPYQDGPTVTLTGTNTWKVYSAEITNAYLGNRQNGGADFRITAQQGMTFYVDLAYVRVPSNRLPAVDIGPTQFEGQSPNPVTWVELCLNPAQWPTALDQTDSLGYADQHLENVSDPDLQQCFGNIRSSGKKFSPAVAVIKEFPACLTGTGCFNASTPRWDRFTALGATMDVFQMDEPFTNVRKYHQGDDSYAVNQTVTWMKLVREKYPHIQLVSIESYPTILSASNLMWWVRALNAACAASSVQIIDFFQVDHDWNAGGTVATLRQVRDDVRANGVLFGVNFWAANKSQSTVESDWYTGLMQHGNMYVGAGFVPDRYSLNDWIHTPRQIIPDTAYPSFTRSVVDFVGAFVRRTRVQPSFVDVAPGHVFYDQVYAVARQDVPGCAWDQDCPDAPTTRGAMARFLLKGKGGVSYVPPKCMAAVFGDVPCGGNEAIWVNELYWRGITSGCGGGNYCPTSSVTREQMAVFLLVTKEGSGYAPPACVTPTFADVPCSSPYARWIEELYRRGITGGCGGGNYCPTAVNSRGQMAVFVDTTFGLN